MARQIGADPSDLCENAIDQAEAEFQTQPGLLAAIARIESGRPSADGAIRPWPWTVNAAGKAYYFPDKAQAIAWTRRARSHGITSLDVGCMQVDLQYHPQAFPSLQQAFDPATNARYGAKFLKSLWQDSLRGNWISAAGFYHSKTPGLAAAYRRLVMASQRVAGPAEARRKLDRELKLAWGETLHHPDKNAPAFTSGHVEHVDGCAFATVTDPQSGEPAAAGECQ